MLNSDGLYKACIFQQKFSNDYVFISMAIVEIPGGRSSSVFADAYSTKTALVVCLRLDCYSGVLEESRS